MGTPFENAGYTKDTVFRVLSGSVAFERNDLLRLDLDDGTACPRFVDQRGQKAYMPLPKKKVRDGESILEVAHNAITPEMLGEIGSNRYEVIRMVLKVLDGDEVTYNNKDYTEITSIDRAAWDIANREMNL